MKRTRDDDPESSSDDMDALDALLSEAVQSSKNSSLNIDSEVKKEESNPLNGKPGEIFCPNEIKRVPSTIDPDDFWKFIVNREPIVLVGGLEGSQVDIADRWKGHTWDNDRLSKLAGDSTVQVEVRAEKGLPFKKETPT